MPSALKKGNPELLSSYKPVSLLSVFLKIFEYAMQDRIMAFLYRHNVISENKAKQSAKNRHCFDCVQPSASPLISKVIKIRY